MFYVLGSVAQNNKTDGNFGLLKFNRIYNINSISDRTTDKSNMRLYLPFYKYRYNPYRSYIKSYFEIYLSYTPQIIYYEEN